MKKINTGLEFLNLIFKNVKDNIKSDASDSSPKIINYLERMEMMHREALFDENKRILLKSFYYDKYIIKELPDSYIKYRKGYFYELGLRNKEEITESDKALVLECIKNDQKQSLDNLLEFLSSEHTQYPTWFKYYVFRGVTNVGTFYPILGKFTKRSLSTTEPYMIVDEKTIDEMYMLISKYLSDENLSPREQKAISRDLNFKNLYSKIYRKNNPRPNIFYENFHDQLDEYIGQVLPSGNLTDNKELSDQKESGIKR